MTTLPLAPVRTLSLRARAGRRGLWAVGWLAASVCAAALALLAAPPPHRVWGQSAAVGYLGAALFACALPRPQARTLSVASALTGAVVIPFLSLTLTGQAQSEVRVVERSAALLVGTGSPYLATPETVTDYNPYLPGMALFGLPRELFGDGSALTRLLGDARLWCALALVACLVAGYVAVRRGGQGRPKAPLTQGGSTPWVALTVLVSSPLVALPLAVSGVDLPLAGLCCLGIALATRGRAGGAALALAAACALKWTALPAVAVVGALLVHRADGRVLARYVAVWLAGTTALVLPFAVLAPGPLVDQVFAFPTGRAAVATPADSPLPGRLLADLGPTGWYTAVALLVCGGVAVALSLVLRPPADVRAAADRLALGLCVAFSFAPAARFGYFALPLVLVVWARIAAGPPGTALPLGSATAAGLRPHAVPGAGVIRASRLPVALKERL
ncbi:glycosyltransferase 87 family protein [Streptomyces sp. NPDC048301]|uniref:glycosyltransferase 87 family protein n=1 Tax=Streptomyces sp. NPDC048301 TaxID=3155631 RepID=UPI00342A37CD